MLGRHDIDPLRGIGPQIDARFVPRQCEMPVGHSRPSQAQVDEFVPIADEVAIDDLAVDADRDSVGVENSDLLVAKAALGDRAKRVHQMDVWVAGHRVHDPIRDHSLRRELCSDELPHQRDAFGRRQLVRQCDHDLAGELTVDLSLPGNNGIPQDLARLGDALAVQRIAQPGGRVHRQGNLLMGEITGVGVAECPTLGLIVHLRAVTIGGGRNGAASCSHDRRPEMWNRHVEILYRSALRFLIARNPSV